MANTTPEKSTPLETWHRQHGGRMARFGSYQMPLWYASGARNEHFAVLQKAGLFDTCHMSIIMVTGGDSLGLLQTCLSKDLNICRGGRPLSPGFGVYGVFLKENGHLLDDTIIFQLAENHYMVCVNSGMGETVSAHLRRYNDSGCTINDLTGKLAKLDLQGPASADILRTIIPDADSLFASFPFLSCRGHFQESSPLANQVRLHNGSPVLLSRSGYTGELGFEIYVEQQEVQELWRTLLHKGKAFGIEACGLAARDSLRTSAVLPLAGHDIGDWPFLHNPWQFAFTRNKESGQFTKEFVGSRALSRITDCPYTYPFVGFDLRKIEPGPDTAVVSKDGRRIGTILTCVSDMALTRINGVVYGINSPDLPADCTPKGLCCGFVLLDQPRSYGETVTIKDSRRTLQVEIVADIRPARTARMALTKKETP